MPTAIARIERAAAAPVAAYSSAVFRILFGLLGVFGVVRFVAKGWVETLYLQPAHHLTYEHFGWVHAWSPPWMYAHVAVVGLASLALAVGFHSRVAAAAYFLAFGYLELIDGALYLNHYWWVTLGAGWLVVLPVHDTWALSSRSPRGTVPAIVVWILRAQLAVVYLFAGLAKLNADWLVDGNPLAIWLDHPELGLLASWSGAFFDCTIVAWLLWPRTRNLAYLVVIVFHAVTGVLFQIGLFPMVMIAGTWCSLTRIGHSVWLVDDPLARHHWTTGPQGCPGPPPSD